VRAVKFLQKQAKNHKNAHINLRTAVIVIIAAAVIVWVPYSPCPERLAQVHLMLSFRPNLQTSWTTVTVYDTITYTIKILNN